MGLPAIVAIAVTAATMAGVAQALTGTLSGLVTESNGGVIPGATVVVVSGTASWTAVTNPAGRFRIDGLPAGTYRAEARLAGFMTRRAEIQIGTGRETAWDVVLRITSAHSDEPASAVDPVDSKLAAGIYEAILRQVYRGAVPPHPQIISKSLIQPYLDDLDWPASLAGVPAALRQQSRSATAQRPVTLRAESFPTGARLLDGEAAVDPPVTSFSRVFVTEDGRDALVVFQHRCGNLCGEGTVVWLRRQSPTGVWVIRALHTFWLS